MASSKNILVLGATGLSGLEFIKQSLNDPSKPHLTLLVRTPSKLPADYAAHSQTTIIEGQLNDATAVQKATKGVTAVVSFLGPYITLSGFVGRSQKTPIADALPILFDAMRSNNVKRILALSTPGAFPIAEDQVNWTWWLTSYLMPKIIVPEGSAEMRGIGMQVSVQQDLEWTLLRVPYLNLGVAELPVEAGPLGPAYRGSTSLSRASFAKWVLREIEEKKWVHKAPVLSNPS